MYKIFLLILILFTTIALCLWPDLHPEKAIEDHYYWQIDVLIHSGYYFLVSVVILFLRLNLKPVYISLALFGLSIVLELLQQYSFNRTVSLMDMGSNLLGISVALILFYGISYRRKQIKKATCTK